MLIRLIDILLAFIGLILILPFFIAISLIVGLGSKGGIFYRQERIGQYGKAFRLLKFRTMHPNADKIGLITIGSKDSRVTREGYYLRKYKLDELPQLINVIIGEMSLVGPRPEVKKYVDLYPKEYQKLHLVRPGITSPASLTFSDESELLSKQNNPIAYYETQLLPQKIALDQSCVEQKGNIVFYFKCVSQTILKVLLS